MVDVCGLGQHQNMFCTALPSAGLCMQCEHPGARVVVSTLPWLPRLPSQSHGTRNVLELAAELGQFHQNYCLAVGLGEVKVVIVVMMRRTQMGEGEHGGSADPDVGLWNPKPPHGYHRSALTAGLAQHAALPSAVQQGCAAGCPAAGCLLSDGCAQGEGRSLHTAITGAN